jgi:hypothetical protein
MAEGTGACGINCLVCGLFKQGKCSPCGSGQEDQAQAKLAAQLNLLGKPCPILSCAVERGIPYCSADCELYPCRHFMSGPYPFSEGFLHMQLRRRSQPGLKPSSGGGGKKGDPGMVRH